jgi:hypothetical protein
VNGWTLIHDWLTALLPSVVKDAKCQLTRVKRCRSKPPSFLPDRPTCHGVLLTFSQPVQICFQDKVGEYMRANCWNWLELLLIANEYIIRVFKFVPNTRNFFLIHVYIMHVMIHHKISIRQLQQWFRKPWSMLNQITDFCYFLFSM